MPALSEPQINASSLEGYGDAMICTALFSLRQRHVGFMLSSHELAETEIMAGEMSYGARRNSSWWLQLPLAPAVVVSLVLTGLLGFSLMRHHPQPLALQCLAATAEPLDAARGMFGHSEDDGRMIVTSLRATGPAARAGLAVGDVLPAKIAVGMAAGSKIPARFTVARDAAAVDVLVDLPATCSDQQK